MKDILSAEEFARGLCGQVVNGYIAGHGAYHYYERCSDLIRSRDAAIIERCKEGLEYRLYGEDYQMAMQVLDSVMADITVG